MHKKGQQPQWMNIFLMISGSIPPADIGLTDRVEIDGLLKKTKFVFSTYQLNEVWSKYLLLSWAMYSILVNVMLFQVIFANSNDLISLILLSYASIAFGVLIFMMNSASAVNKEANRSHPLINSLILSNKTRRLPIGRRLKVFQLS